MLHSKPTPCIVAVALILYRLTLSLNCPPEAPFDAEEDAEIYLLANSSEVEKGPRMDRFGDFRQEVKFVGEMDAAVARLPQA